LPGAAGDKLPGGAYYYGDLLGTANASPAFILSLGSINPVAFSPDGRSLAAAGWGQVRLWDMTKSREGPRFHTHAANLVSVAFSPDAKLLMGGSLWGNVGVWEAATGKEVRAFQANESGLDALVFSPDGKLLALAGLDRTIHLWDVAAGKERHSLSGGEIFGTAVAFSPDGKLLASGGRFADLRLWDTVTGKQLRALPGPPRAVTCVTFSPDGKVVAVASKDKMIRLWEVATGRELHPFVGQREGFVGQREGFKSLSFSPDGKLLISGGSDRGISLWEVVTRQEIKQFEGQKDEIVSVVFSPNGDSVAAGSRDGTIRIWNVIGRARGRRPESVTIFPADWQAELPLQMHGTRPRPRPPAAGEKFVSHGNEQDGPEAPEDPSPQAREALWADLASKDAPQAYRALWTLVAAPEQALLLLRDRLRPAAYPERAFQLVAELDSEHFALRKKATRELEQLGEAAEPALRKALAGQPSLELLRRAERLLEKLDGTAPTSDRLRALRGTAVLEHIGTPEARRLLTELAQGMPDARLTQEARASLQRLAHQGITRFRCLSW
jgi:dipeptidyl aminopeptidase/acylaminoacyl peptidase